uniref:Glyco_hydro_2_C domain-containing protein n=1 Tax=Globodera pallida TaxID=36090 RepID=A0A183C987_GLOPA
MALFFGFKLQIRLESVSSDGSEKLLDVYRETFGFRTVTVDQNRIYINGLPFYCHGFGMHEDIGIHGRGFDRATMVKDLNMFDWLNGNCYRTSHYPYAEERAHLADRRGIAVNTLCMHLLEQLDMHFFAFAALSNAIAYLLSRESSNPQFVKLLWNATWHRLTTRPEVVVVANEKQQQHSSQSSLSGPSPPKQLLSCCILTNNGSTSVTRRNSPMRLKKGTKNGQTNSGGEKMANEEEECSLIGFGIHRTLMFQTGQPHLEVLLAISCVLISLLNHNVYSQMRAKNPWKLFARPILRSHEYGQFEPTVEAKLTVFEKLYPLLIISLISTSGKAWNSQNGHLTTLVLTMCAVRLARTGYAQPNVSFRA